LIWNAFTATAWTLALPSSRRPLHHEDAEQDDHIGDDAAYAYDDIISVEG
jgi:hypothetical protein